MTTKNSEEALRLSEQLRDLSTKFKTPSHEKGVCNGASFELRRLHEANQAMLAALKRIAAIELQMNGGDWDEITEAQAIAEAAIAKAEGMNKGEQQ